MLEQTDGAQQGADEAASATQAAEANRNAQEGQSGERQEGAEETGQREGGEEGRETEREPDAQPEAEAKTEEGRGKLPKWMQDRINELTRQRHEEARARRAAEEELARLRGAPGGDEAGQEGAEAAVRERNPQMSDEQVRAAAQQLRAQERFDETCNTTFEEGSKKFTDFAEKMGTFRLLGGLQPEFLEAAFAAGNAHMTLHHLGSDPEEAARIMALPPKQQMAAMTRLSDKLSAPKPAPALSKAPAPIDPVGGAGRPSALNTDPDALSTDEWMRRRNAGEIR